MRAFLTKHLSTFAVALVAGAIGASAPAIAHGVSHALFAHNADKLDKVDSTGFVKGKNGRSPFSVKELPREGLVAPTRVALLNLPGFGSLEGGCYTVPGPDPLADFSFVSSSSQLVRTQGLLVYTPASGQLGFKRDGSFVENPGSSTEGYLYLLTMSKGTGATAKVAEVTISIRNGANEPCRFETQARLLG